MVSMDDVAAKASVSKATVSRVLNGKAEVSALIREKVIAACADLNYKLNSSIQDLILKSRNGATRNIAFVLVGREFADPAYARLIDAISSGINQYHYQLMLVKLTGSETNIYDLPPVLRDERVDGILLAGVLEPHTVKMLKEFGPQCVVLGSFSERLLDSLSNVYVNIDQMVYRAVKQLYDCGCRRIAIAEECPGNHAAVRMVNAFKLALADWGLACDDSTSYWGSGPYTGIFEVLAPVFAGKELPFDGIFCHDYRLAEEVSHLVMAHYGLNRRVDFTIATFRQFEYYRLPVPAVFVDMNQEKMVEMALQQLIGQIEGRLHSRTILVNLD